MMWESFRCSAAERLTKGIEDCHETEAVLHAMLLGYRKSLPKNLYQAFRDSGTVHIFAISGLHVGMIVAILFVLLPLTGLSRQVWFPIVLPVLLAYTVATGARPSAVRACLMALAFFLGPLLGRRPDGPSSLALAALLIVAWQPHQLLNAGFVFSFTVVSGLMLLGTPLYVVVRGVLGWHVMDVSALRIASESGTGGVGVMGQRLRLWAKTRFGQLLALSIAAWLSSVPLTAYYFGRISLASLLANIAIIPLAFFVVLCGCLSLVTGAVWSGFAEIFNNASLAVITVLTTVTRVISALPFSVIVIPKPPLWLVVCWYAGLISLALWLRKRQKALDRERVDWMIDL